MSAEKPILTENRAVHTPGPWTMVGREIFGNAFDGSARLICDHVRGGSPYAADANARLIAAAPDLLDVAQRFRALYANTVDLIGPSVRALLNDLNAALAKAEGVQ